MLKELYSKYLAPLCYSFFFRDLIEKTQNFGSLKWLGKPIWQNVLDLWVIQETIFEIKPELLIETGTHQGGSSLFYANLFDAMGKGNVLTVDLEKTINFSHPRITFFTGDSISEITLKVLRKTVSNTQGPILVILDSNHSEQHVRRELELYSPFVSPGSFLLVQDGVIDTHPIFSNFRPGPIPAIDDFLKKHQEFEIDENRCRRFLISHHPKGWLKRKKTD